MQRIRWVFLAAAIPAALLSMVGCTASPHDPTEKYVLVATNRKLQYWQNALEGLTQAVREMKVKGEMVGPETYDPAGEHDAFQRALQEKPSGILISAADAKLMTPDINSAIGQGVPVITIDSDAPESKRLLFVGTDNYKAGTVGGKLTAKLLNGKGNVVVFTIPSQLNLEDRLHGYESVFADYPGIKITQVVDIKGDPTVAFDTSRKLLEGKEKVDAFVCLEAIACPEVGDVVNRANMKGKVTIVAMDTDQRTIHWIQEGVISATIAQKPYTMAYYGTKLLDDLHHHPPTPLAANWAENANSPIPMFVDTGTFLIDRDNVGAFVKQSGTSGTSPQ